MQGRSSGRHAVVALTGQWLKYVVQIVALVLFSRLLDADQFGVVAMVLAVANVAHVLGDLGLSHAALQAKTLTDAQRSNLFWLTAGVGVIIALVLAGLAPVLATLYHQQAVTAITLALTLVFLANGLAPQFRTELARAKQFGALATSEVVSQVAGLVVGLSVTLLGGSYWGLVVQQIVAAWVSLAWVAFATPWWPGWAQRRAPMDGMLRFGALTLAAQLVNYVSSNVDSFLIGRQWGAETLGLYNRAYNVARQPILQIASPLTRVVLPHLVAKIDDRDQFAASVVRAQLVLTAALLGALSFIAAAADPLVAVVLGPGWHESVPFIRALCLGGAFQAMGYIYYWVLLAHGRTGILFGAELGARTVMIALMIIAAPHGAIWVALAAASGQLLLLISGAVVSLPRIGLRAWPLLSTAARNVLLFGTAGAATFLTLEALPGGWVRIADLGIAALVWWAVVAAFQVCGPYRRDTTEIVRYARSVIADR